MHFNTCYLTKILTYLVDTLNFKSLILKNQQTLITNQKTNAFLKEIQVLCDIKQHLNFHMARHTFATTITLSQGVPIESVSEMLGHSNIKITQIYAKILKSKIRKDTKGLMKG